MHWHGVQTKVKDLISELQLPPDYLQLVRTWYWPLVNVLSDTALAVKVVGINGAQGSGKSTMARVLSELLQYRTGLRCAVVSIDDFYLTLEQRQQLGEDVHPLLRVRGVPGTHDVKLAQTTLQRLSTAAEGEKVQIPRFNKATDDRHPESAFSCITGPVDIVILEGWCVGANAQPADELLTPINKLERTQDKNRRWRQYVNQQLAGSYQHLYSMIDCLIMLKAPSIQTVEEWRWLQESKLISTSKGEGGGLMNRQQISEFIQYYQRLTEHCLREMPERAALVYHLNDHHRITKASGPLAKIF